MKKEIKIFCVKDWFVDNIQDETDYEMLDTGDGEKLERFGKYTFVRPCENAIWNKTLDKKVWDKADAVFVSSKTGNKAGWVIKNKKLEKRWIMSYRGIKFFASPTSFRHLSFFPEQATHWDFIEEKIKTYISLNFSPLRPSLGASRGTKWDPREQKIERNIIVRPKFLNLFGYTGVASLFALRAGAEVTHIDASKNTLQTVKENQNLSGLSNLPMRILLDDTIKFLEREIKRGNKYDAIIMDPPKFGRGPKGEIWNIEKDLPKLLSLVRGVLSDKPIFVILNAYSIDMSSLSLGYYLEEHFSDLGGIVSNGELCLLEKSNNRFITLSNTAIWNKD